MITLQALMLSAALAAPGQTLLLDFYSDSCAPCRSMEPTVRRLLDEGYAIRKVNVEHEQQISRRFRVDRIPTYVMVADGQEVHRVVGPASYDQLRQMLASAGSSPAAASPPATQFVATAPPAPAGGSPAGPAANGSPAVDPQMRALQATVRLRIDDPSGTSYGTGTIIHARGGEALILTCGHLFRDSSGQGRIDVDLFAPGTQGPAPGKLLAYDLKNDVALVITTPHTPVAAVPVAAPGYQVRRQEPVFSIGCDRGADPTIRPSHVTALNKYQGPANIEVAGQPVIGRSGGGLFTQDGRLIGVCNAADPKDNEGLYAALSVLHDHLTANLPAGILQQDPPQIASAAASAAVPAPAPAPVTAPIAPPMPLAGSSPAPPNMPRQMPGASAVGEVLESVPAIAAAAAGNRQHLPSLLRNVGGDAEVIVIVRSKADPKGTGQLVIFDSPTPDMLNFLAAQHAAQQAPATALPTTLEAEPAAEMARQPDRYNSGQSEILRAQSLR